MARHSSQIDTKPPTKRPKRVPRWQREGKLLAAFLLERNIGKSDFAKKLNRKYLAIHQWTEGYGFEPANQVAAARLLGLADDAFGSTPPPETTSTRRALRDFRKTRLGQSLTPAQWRVLQSMRFDDETFPPSVAMFESVAWALKGAIRLDEILPLGTRNAEIDQQVSHTRPRKKR